MEEIHNNQPNEVLPYQYEPEAMGNTSSSRYRRSSSEVKQELKK